MFDDHRPGKELDDTHASAADDRLEEILRKVKAAGGEITMDEKIPLQIEFNNEIVEIGTRRVIQFTLGPNDFHITRDIKNVRVAGGGHKKFLEEISRPMIETKLKRKPSHTDQWIGVDFEDLF